MTRFRDWLPWGIVENGRPLHSLCVSRPSDTASDLLLYAHIRDRRGRPHQRRFTYNGTFSKAFMGCQPNGTADQMRSSDIWRVKDGGPRKGVTLP
jgi:hypothetical protein